MITVEELIIQSLYHRMVVVNVRRTYTVSSSGGRIDALALLIHGARRMRTTMGAQEQMGRPPQGEPVPPMLRPPPPPGPPDERQQSGGTSIDPWPEGSVVQVKSREGTLDFGDDVQIILDTGEIKLVKATQKTTEEIETQTDFSPMWFFGFDPTTAQAPAVVTTPDGTVVAVPEGSDMHSIPAVDLSRFEQFSVIHYSDTRDPENRKLVMIQTPGSKMHRPEDLCTEDMAVQNRPMLEVPSSRRQFMDRKTKSLDNSVLTRQTSSSATHQPQHTAKLAPHDSMLKRQERVVVDNGKSLCGHGDGGAMSRDSDALLQDPDIDSGIWDMVHGRDVRLGSGDAKVASPANIARTSSPSTSNGGKDQLSKAGDDVSGDHDIDDNELVAEAGTWHELYQQIGELDKARPTISYRVFHVQDQPASITNDAEEMSRPESPMLDQSASPQPVEASTPRERAIQALSASQLSAEHAERLTERIEQLADGHPHPAKRSAGRPDPGQMMGDGPLLPDEKPDAEDSGWLFDKIPAMQGSLIHSPMSPSSPNPFPLHAPTLGGAGVFGCDVTHVGAGGGALSIVTQDDNRTDSQDDLTPTTDSLCVPQEALDLEGSSVSEEFVEATSHPELANCDSQESTETVTEECVEDQRAQLGEKQTEASNQSRSPSPTSDDADLSKAVSELTTSDSSRFYHILFDEQEDLVDASYPCSRTVEEMSFGEISRSSTNTNDIFESCDEGDDSGLHISMEMIVKETKVIETVTITTTTSTPENSDPSSRSGSVGGSPERQGLISGDRAGWYRARQSQTSPLPSPITPSSSTQPQAPLPKLKKPLVHMSSPGDGGGVDVLPAESRGCVVHRSGARPKQKPASPRHGPHLTAAEMGLGSLFSDEPVGTLINGQAHRSTSHEPDDAYLLNRDGTLTNVNSGVIHRSGARPKNIASRIGVGDRSPIQGLNHLMLHPTSTNVVHSHVVTELTAARARLKMPELRRTPDRHSIASSDSENTSHDSSLAASPTSTSVEELASVGSNTCLLAEVMPVASYSDWMSVLPKRLHTLPLTRLAIPGSNVSFAIESEMRTDMSFSKCNLEMAEFLRKLPPLAIFDNFRKVMKDVWRAWMPKQILSVAKQLEAGVRYLDIHITRYRSTFYGEHGLYTRSLKHYLRHVDTFTQKHPHEVVILHFQRLAGLSLKDKRALVTLLFQFFGARLCPQMDTACVTLEQLWANRRQVIAVLPDVDMPALNNHIFAALVWSSRAFRCSLPRKQTTRELMTYLESVYDERREPHEFHTLQAVVSPDMNMVFGDCAHKSMRSLTLCETSPYLKVWLPGKINLNIVTVDFVGIFDLTGEIIKLNNDKKAETIV